MRERDFDYIKLRDHALGQVDTCIQSEYAGSLIPSVEISKVRSGKYEVGYKLTLAEGRTLNVFFDTSFPYSPPQIFLPDTDKVLVWPHVEYDGRLCVLSQTSSIDPAQPVEVLKFYLDEALKLIESCSTGENHNHFKDEFVSYWQIVVDAHAPAFVSVVKPNGGTRNIKVWRAQKSGSPFRYFGENVGDLSNWLDNSFGPKVENPRKFKDALLVVYEDAPYPSGYPKTAEDVINILISQNLLSEFQHLFYDAKESMDILIAVKTTIGTGFAGLTLSKLDLEKAQKGFRPGKIPEARKRHFANSRTRKALPASVERADGNWVHGRDQDKNFEELEKCTVAIIGCGALGGSMAHILAQSGIGNFVLVDGQILGRENTCRHPLGASHSGQYKASAMGSFLRKEFPHISNIKMYNRIFTPQDNEIITEISKANLIISATGEWSSMCSLADVSRSFEVQLQTTWLEPKAVAAHSVITNDIGACLRCGFSTNGVPIDPVSYWPDESHWNNVPACGGVFSPFGSADLSIAAGQMSLASIDALLHEPIVSRHIVWSMNHNRIEEFGGMITECWSELVGSLWSGEWEQSKKCQSCQ